MRSAWRRGLLRTARAATVPRPPCGEPAAATRLSPSFPGHQSRARGERRGGRARAAEGGRTWAACGRRGPPLRRAPPRGSARRRAAPERADVRSNDSDAGEHGSRWAAGRRGRLELSRRTAAWGPPSAWGDEAGSRWEPTRSDSRRDRAERQFRRNAGGAVLAAAPIQVVQFPESRRQLTVIRTQSFGPSYWQKPE